MVARRRVTPALLASNYQDRAKVYLQSVPAGLGEQNVAARWGKDVLQILEAGSARASRWRQDLARVAYQWLSAKTQGATQLFWWNDLVLPLVAAGKRSAGDLPRLDLPPETRQAAIDNYVRSQPPAPEYTYYHRTVRDGPYLCLQYWFFYAYNDWATGYGGMNDHEGDWEGIYLFFEIDEAGRPQEPPAYVTFVGHHSRLTKPWGHHDVMFEGSHPVGYVAGGSHATYPERKEYDLMRIYDLVDYATGDGVTIRPGDWQRRVDLQTQPWVSAFVGSWGTRYWLERSWAGSMLGALRKRVDEFGLPGVSAPRGPRYTDEGAVRPNWTGAVNWAGIPDLLEG